MECAKSKTVYALDRRKAILYIPDIFGIERFRLLGFDVILIT